MSCALQSNGHHAARAAMANEAVQPCPKGAQALYHDTRRRESECYAVTHGFLHRGAEDLCHKPLGSRPPSGGEEGHKLAKLALLWASGGGNPSVQGFDAMAVVS